MLNQILLVVSLRFIIHSNRYPKLSKCWLTYHRIYSQEGISQEPQLMLPISCKLNIHFKFFCSCFKKFRFFIHSGEDLVETKTVKTGNSVTLFIALNFRQKLLWTLLHFLEPSTISTWKRWLIVPNFLFISLLFKSKKIQ